MKLTKEQIEDIEVGGDDQEWEISIDMTMDDMRELRRLALLGLERDERAERIGRAVLLSFGYAPFTYYKWADALERHTLVTPARLLRAIADALKEADDAE